MSKKIDWQAFKQRLLQEADFAQFYEAVATKGAPNSKGWQAGHCPFHDDKSPSFGFNLNTGRWKCLSGCGGGSVFDYLIQTNAASNMAGAMKIIADSLRIEMPRPTKPKLTEEMLAEHSAALRENDVAKRYLMKDRALSWETIDAYRLGLSQGYTTFPLFADGELVNIRRRSSNGTMSHWTEKVGDQWVGYGSPARLYPNNDIDKSKLVVLCEGEIDTLLLRQEGIQSFTGTHGSGTFLAAWALAFVGCDVAIVYDLDEAGRKGAAQAAEKLVKSAERVRVVNLPLPGGSDDNDVSDWIRRHEGSGEKLLALIEAADPIGGDDSLPLDESDAIKLDSLRDSYLGSLQGKLVEVELTITGATSKIYTVPEVVRVNLDACKGEKKGLCLDCKGAASDYRIPLGESVRLAGCGSSRSYTEGELARHCCKHGKRPEVNVLQEHGAREVFAHEIVDRSSSSYREQSIYLREDAPNPKPGNYAVRGWALTIPRNSTPTILVESMTRLEDDFESFKASEHREDLEIVRSVGFDGLVEDLRDNVTQIYHRDDLLRAVLLTFFSPRRITFQGNELRGWLNTFIVGDAGTGKTQTYERLANHLGLGASFSALTGSRTGLLYAVVESKAQGWSVRVGAHPQNTGRILGVDEVQFLPEWELRTLSKAMDEGHFKVDRVVSQEYESETRMVLMANPKNDRVLGSFSPGCRALSSIAPPAVVRRIDLPVFLGAKDLEGYSLGEVLPGELRVPAEALRAAVLWAWSLEPKQVTFTRDAELAVLDLAPKLTESFGWAADLPLMHSSDAHNTLARIAAAWASVSLSTGAEGFDALRVEEGHVLDAGALWRRLGEARAAGLSLHSDRTRLWNDIGHFELLASTFTDGLRKDIENDWPLREVINVLWDEGPTSPKDLRELCGNNRAYVNEVNSWLRRLHFVRLENGKLTPSPKLLGFLAKLEKVEPSLFKSSRLRLGDVKLPSVGQSTVPFA